MKNSRCFLIVLLVSLALIGCNGAQKGNLPTQQFYILLHAATGDFYGSAGHLTISATDPSRSGFKVFPPVCKVVNKSCVVSGFERSDYITSDVEIEIGCWKATQAGDNYTVPEPCTR